MNYELLGRLAEKMYLAEIERVKAKIARRVARQNHLCQREDYPHSPKCHEDLALEEFCDDCKFVQPYHEAYRQAALRARLARYTLTMTIQRMLKAESK